ncbi:MAG: hypothetical protein OCD02_02450 [Spirochaetaceae bacterium]
MKKAIALLATLVVLTSSAFAQLAPSISGSAETKWGVNLDDETNGFETDASVTVTIPLAAGEAATEGEDAYGAASITGTTITLDLNLTTDDGDYAWGSVDDDQGELIGTGDLGEISAKIDFANGAYVTVGSESDLAANFVDGDKDYWVKPSFDENEGVSLGYATDTMSIELTIANETDGFLHDGNDNTTDEGYVGDTDIIAEDKIVNVDEVTADDTIPTDEDGYFIGATAMYTAGAIFTLDFALATNATGTLLDDADKKTAVGVKVTSSPIDGLTVIVPFDFLTTDAGTAMELLPTVAYTMDALTFGLDFHYMTVAEDVLTANSITATEDYVGTTLNASVAYTLDAGTAKVAVGSDLGEMDSDTNFDVEVSFTADVYNVTADLGNVADFGEMGLDAGFTGVTGLTATLETTLNGDVDFTLDNLNLDFDSAITGLENTVLTVNYSGFSTDDTSGTFYVGAKISL